MYSTVKTSLALLRHEKVTIDNGEIVKQWRERLARKFTKLPSIRALHDFVIMKHILTDAVIMRVRELCYTGSFSNTTMKLVRGATATDVIIPTNHDSYKETNQCHKLSATKLADLKVMYFRFIQHLLWPEHLQ